MNSHGPLPAELGWNYTHLMSMFISMEWGYDFQGGKQSAKSHQNVLWLGDFSGENTISTKWA